MDQIGAHPAKGPVVLGAAGPFLAATRGQGRGQEDRIPAATPPWVQVFAPVIGVVLAALVAATAALLGVARSPPPGTVARYAPNRVSSCTSPFRLPRAARSGPSL